MSAEIILLLLIFIVCFAGLIFYVNSKMSALADIFKNNDSQKVLMEWLNQMRGSVDKSAETLQSQMMAQTRDFNQRIDASNKVMNDLQKELGSMSEIGRSMQSLQDFLKSPKLRGNIGEQVLNDLLAQMLPSENYALQYEFKNNQKVDAVLKTEEGLIAIDSKFPMENFTALYKASTEELRERARKDFVRDVKKHIDKISQSYILPAEKTVDFAVMYIPSEAIYYEIVVNNAELNTYSWSKRVLPVSPNVFYSFIKAVLIGLEGKKIEEKAKIIMQSLRSIQNDSERVGGTIRLVNKHLTNAKNVSDEAISEYTRMESKIFSINKIALEKKQPELIE